MIIKAIDGLFNISKVSSLDNIDVKEQYIFISKTDEEISIVHKNNYIINNVIEKEIDYKLFKIDEKLDFSLIGIISKISTILKNSSISIFVISTFNTDYFLVKDKNYNKTIEILKENGYTIE